jgi:hypothetical protein
LTQIGLKRVLKCDMGLISRILNKNIDRGLIERKQLKIINKDRKQLVYFLTHEGLQYASELKRGINNIDIKSIIKFNNSYTQKKIFEYVPSAIT